MARRRPVEWVGWNIEDDIPGSVPEEYDLVSSTVLNDYTAPTITRIVGDLTFSSERDRWERYRGNVAFRGDLPGSRRRPAQSED